jgi:hypothetical protein
MIDLNPVFLAQLKANATIGDSLYRRTLST